MDMTNEQMEAALEYDAAQKKAAGSGQNGGGVGVQQTTVATAELVDSLDIKNAYLSKSVAMAFVDLARGCCAVAHTAVLPPVDMSGAPKGLTVDTEKAGQLLEFAERAVKIARELDVLGDKNILRVQEAPKTEQ